MSRSLNLLPMTQVCSRCQEPKDSDKEFALADSKTGRRSKRCKSCSNASASKWYKENKSEKAAQRGSTRAAWGIKRRAENKQLLAELKTRPCFDCKIQYNHWQMQFDHRDGSMKKDNLSTMAHNCETTEALLAEAEKCDVVCANCHSNRTYQRRMGLWP
jgi:hypothetical protein